MKVLVTGATGFLGGRTCEVLNKQGYTVIGVGRNEKKKPKNIVFFNVDLSKKIPANIWQGIDVVVHCAAKSSVWGTFNDFYKNNVLVTRLLLEDSIKYSIKKFIYISSTSVYFDFTNRINITEEDNVASKFVNSYAKTKFLAEQEVLFASKKGLPCIILRPRAIFGSKDVALLPRLINANNEKFFPEICDKGGPLIDITYVDNVVHAIICSIKAKDSCLGQIYNITNGEPILLQKTIKRILPKLGYKYNGKKIPFIIIKYYAMFLELFYSIFIKDKEPKFTKYSIGLISYNQTFNIKKSIEELNYKPIVSIEEGLKEVIINWKI